MDSHFWECSKWYGIKSYSSISHGQEWLDRYHAVVAFVGWAFLHRYLWKEWQGLQNLCFNCEQSLQILMESLCMKFKVLEWRQQRNFRRTNGVLSREASLIFLLRVGEIIQRNAMSYWQVSKLMLKLYWLWVWKLGSSKEEWGPDKSRSI